MTTTENDRPTADEFNPGPDPYEGEFPISDSIILEESELTIGGKRQIFHRSEKDALKTADSIKFTSNTPFVQDGDPEEYTRASLFDAKEYFFRTYKSLMRTLSALARERHSPKKYRSSDIPGLFSRTFWALKFYVRKEGLGNEKSFENRESIEELALRKNFLYYVSIMNIDELFRLVKSEVTDEKIATSDKEAIARQLMHEIGMSHLLKEQLDEREPTDVEIQEMVNAVDADWASDGKGNVTAIEFFQIHYGNLVELGMTRSFLLRKDKTLYHAVTGQCRRQGIDVNSIIPRTTKTLEERMEIAKASGFDMLKSLSAEARNSLRAFYAAKGRRQRARPKSAR